MHKKTLGLDLGTKTLGISYLDPLGIIHGVENFNFPYLAYSRAKKRTIELVKEKDIVRIVIGLPLNMDGSESEMSKACRIFASRLEEALTNVEVILQDERLTSLDAIDYMNELGLDYKTKKEKIDMFASIKILEAYLAKEGEN